MKKYLKRIAIAASVLVNVILGGESNQTFSARNRAWQKSNMPNLVWLIDLICGKDHCSQCYAYWLIRKNKW